jgi:hypothetical protein
MAKAPTRYAPNKKTIIGESPMKNYFTFGSNLSFTQMGERCPEHRKVGRRAL